MNNIILIYEEIPEHTTIAHLRNPEDLKAANLTLDDLKSVAGIVINSDEPNDRQQEIMDTISEALAEPDGEAASPYHGVWYERIIDHMRPLDVGGPATIIWCGFAL